MSDNSKAGATPLDPAWGDATRAVRAGSLRSPFGEHSEAAFMTSSFMFESAEQAAARFSGEEDGYIYYRFSNPSVAMFEARLAALEGAERCVATSTGMAAILSLCMGLLKAGDHIVASKSLFGSTIQLFNTVLPKFGVTTTYVELSDISAWEAAIQPETRLLFAETPSNPLTELVDIAALASLSKSRGVWLAVDNCFCTPIGQKPLALGADFVVHSAAKYLDGQGRLGGGAVLGKHDALEPVFGFLRTAGPTLSAYNAWMLLKGMETLPIRMKSHSDNAQQLAQWLARHPKVERVYYPGLEDHPHYAVARAQMKLPGGMLSFIVKGGRDAAWKVVNGTQLMSITANLGDVKTTITHPATTTHNRITPEARAAAGIVDGLLRISVGLEDVSDLQADLARGLDSL